MKLSKSKIQLILEEGEGYCIEFKKRIAGLDKELVAFTNKCFRG